MDKCLDSSHEGNGTPGHGIVFPAVKKLLSAVDALIDLDVGGSGPSGRALALVTRRQGELIDASAKCDAKVAILRRQLARRDSRIAELEAALRVERLLGDEARAYVKSVDEKLPGYVDGLRARIAELEAKLDAAARLATDSAKRADSLAKDLAAANERAGRLEAQISGCSDYDPGLINDYGGGNVDWWMDYVRGEVNRANEFWRYQIDRILGGA